jgi:hypothetical protein
MAGKKRDEFPSAVQRTVAERASYICTNPDCRDWTLEPHSDPEKSLKTGEAAHIRAASPGGPRYDANQTAEERVSIHNAIWLCAKCSTAIDKDEIRYPVSLLLSWKRNHEEWLKNGGIVPALPEISINTLAGYTLPEQPVVISLKECKDLREHRLRVCNSSDAAILMIDARLQLSEPIVACWGKERPPGVEVQFQPDRPDITVAGTGTVTRTRPPLPSTAFRLRIDRLPAKHAIEIAIYTSMKAHQDHDLTFGSGPFAELMGREYLIHFIDGTYQFEYRGATLTKRFFAPIRYDKDTRATSVIEVRVDQGDWRPVEMSLMS